MKGLVRNSNVRLALLVFVTIVLIVASPLAAATTVLVLEDSDGSTFRGTQLASKTTGFTITSEGPTAFAARTNFSSSNVVYFHCVLGTAARNAAKNNTAFQTAAASASRVVLTGIHADDHGNPGAGQFLQDSITWIGQTGGILGLCDFPVINWNYLPFLGVTASSTGTNPQDDNVTFVLPKHPIFANTTDGPGTFTLDNWGQTVHAVWNTLGPGNGGYEDNGFVAVATSNSGVCAIVREGGGPVGCPPHRVHGHISTLPPTHSGDSHQHHGKHGHTVQAGCFTHIPHPGASPGSATVPPSGSPGPDRPRLSPEPEEVVSSTPPVGVSADFAAVLNEDGTPNGDPGVSDMLGTKLLPGKRGSVLQIFGSAAGFFLGEPEDNPALSLTPPASGSPLFYTTSLPQVRIGGVSAKVLFSGLAPGLTGVWQVNVLVPAEVPSGSLPVTVFYEGDELKSIDVVVE